MLYAEKGNKVLKIEATEADEMQSQGFDIVEVSEKGTRTIKKHGAGKTVPYEDFEKVSAELEKLKATQKKETKGKPTDNDSEDDPQK